MPDTVWASDPLTFWRERILFVICFTASALGPFALIPSLALAFLEKLWTVIFLDTGAYLTALVILFPLAFVQISPMGHSGPTSQR